ncbi:hypothetical protein Ancab_035364 [Ancistrocladus abbreviatus]
MSFDGSARFLFAMWVNWAEELVETYSSLAQCGTKKVGPRDLSASEKQETEVVLGVRHGSLPGVTAADMTGIETFFELKRLLDAKNIKSELVNPRIQIIEKLMASKVIDAIREESLFLTVQDVVRACQFRFGG